MTVAETIGQILGILNIILVFTSYQMKSDKKILFTNLAVCAVFVIHYILLGAITAAAMNGVCILRNVTYLRKDKKFYMPRLFPIFFAIVMLVFGVYTSNGIHSVLIIFGLVINTLCMSFKNPQNIRKSILITSPMVLLYDIIEHSVGGSVCESISIVSAVVGIIKYSKNNNNTESEK